MENYPLVEGAAALDESHYRIARVSAPDGSRPGSVGLGLKQGRIFYLWVLHFNKAEETFWNTSKL